MITLVNPVQYAKAEEIPYAYHRHAVYGFWDYNISACTGISGDCNSAVSYPLSKIFILQGNGG